MRVLIVSHAFPPMIGGVETHLWDLSQGLASRGHEVRCLVGGGSGRTRHGGVAVTRTPLLSIETLLRRRARDGELDPRLLARLVEALTSVVDDAAPDLIHVHNAHHFAPEPAHACFRAAMGRPVVNSVHDRVGEHLHPEVLRLPWACTIFASSYLASVLPVAGPSLVRHLGIDLTRFSATGPRATRMTSLRRPVLFHPARLLRWKGVLVSARALVSLRADFPEATLVLCGSEQVVDEAASVGDVRREIERLAHEAGVEAGIRFLSFSSLDMPAAYRAADVVWYPTIDEEPLGLVPVEAMACGRPVIVSRSGGMIETVEDGLTGFVVPKGDPGALADATRRLLADGARRAAMTRNALARARRFELPAYLSAIEGVYRQAMLEGSPL